MQHAHQNNPVYPYLMWFFDYIGANVGRITLGILIFSAGMFVSSTALLPSTTSMYLCMLSHGAWFQQSYELAIFFTALSTFVR